MINKNVGLFYQELSKYPELAKSLKENQSVSTENSSNQTTDLKEENIKVASDAIQNMNSKNIDWEYMKHLDLEIGSVALNTGLVENFRFNNGYITSIKTENNKRDWNKDAGEGSANVMTSLFPSTSGALNGNDGPESISFSQALAPKPEFMAKLIGMVYDIRQDVDSYEKILNKFPDESKFFDSLNSKRLGKDFDEIVTNLKLEGKLDSKALNLEDLDKIIKEYENKENLRADQKISKIKVIKEAIATLKLSSFYKTNSINTSNLKLIKQILKNIYIMITKQECAGENPTDKEIKDNKFLPKYTLERMLLAYFVDRFSEQDNVKEFYQALEPLIKGESKVTKDEAIKDIGNLHKMYDLSTSLMKTLYKSDLISNGSTKILKKGQEEKIEITQDTFADCADTSARHVINLMTYDSENNNFPLCEPKKEDTEKYLQNLKKLKDKINKNEKDTINKNETFEFKNLKDRLNLFYLHQTADKANDGETVTRTLWNYVIGNMNEDMNEAKGDLYALKYVRDTNNEFDTGFLNALKLYYNIAYALKDGEECDAAKKAIDDLAQVLEDKNLEAAKDKVKVALEKTLKLFKSDNNYKIDIKTDKLFIDGTQNDLMGTADITVSGEGVDLFEFSIYQGSGHALTQQDFKQKIKLEEKDEKTLLQNQDAALLYSWANGSQSQYGALNNFNFKFSKPNATKDAQNSFEKKADALNSLRFIEQQQGIKGNSRAIFDYLKTHKINLEEVKSIGLIKMQDEKKTEEKISLASFIYNVIDDKDDFIYRYVENNEFSDDKYKDEFIKGQAVALIENLESICQTMKKDTISLNDLQKFEKIGDFLFKIFNGKSLISIAIDKLNKDDFGNFINGIQDNKNLIETVVCNNLNAFEYAVKTNQFEKAAIIAANLEKINSYKIIVEENGNKYTALGWLIKNGEIDFILQNQNKFDLYSKAYTDNQQKDHTAMAFVVESLDDTKCSEFIRDICRDPDSKNALQNRTIFLEGGQYLTAFEYAVKNNKPEKAKVIADNLEKINSYNMIVEENGNQYTALGWLIKAGQIDFILQNPNKFDLYSKAYTDNQQKDYTVMRFAIENFEDQGFSSFIGDICQGSDGRNKLQGNTVFSKDGQNLNAFEYAVKNNKPEKAKIIAANLETINSNNMIVEENGNQYTALGWLIKEGEIDFILQNQDKFDLYSKAYTDNQQKDHTAMAFVIESLKDDKFSEFIRDLLYNNPDSKNQLQSNTVFSEDGKNLNAFEYAVKNNKPEKAKIIAANLEKIDSYNGIVEENGNQYTALGWLIKEGEIDFILQNQDKFDLYSKAYTDNQQKDHTAMAFVIESLDDKKCSEFIQNLINKNSDSKNQLQYNTVFSEDGQNLNAFEYAVKNNQPETAKIIADNFEKINSYNMIVEENGNQYTALGWLIKAGEIDFILQNQNKFNLYSKAYTDNQQKDHTAMAFVIESLDDKKFSELIQNLINKKSDSKNQLQDNTVFSKDGQYLNAFEYAVKISNFDNAKVIAANLEKIDSYNGIVEENGN